MKCVCNGCYEACWTARFAEHLFQPNNEADQIAILRARVEKKDPEAIFALGKEYYHGARGLKKDVRKAVELWTEAAEHFSTLGLRMMSGGNGLNRTSLTGIY